MGEASRTWGAAAVALLLVASAIAVAVPAVSAAENQPPIARFGYSPEHPAPGEEVVFSAHESGDEDGEVTRYAWDLDGDGTTDATGVEVGFVYDETGAHVVSLTVTDDDGATATKERTVEVAENEAPRAFIVYEPDHPGVGDGVVFSGHESHDADGEIVAYRWDLDGDGVADEDGVKVDRRFEVAGEHVVGLTVEDDDGATHTTEVVVEVVENHAPTAAVHYEPEHPSVGEGVLFSARESHDPDGEVVSYHWDFTGDGEPDADGPKADWRFEAAGDHQVTLTVTDDDGAEARATATVHVAETEPPSAAIVFDPREPAVGTEVVLSARESHDPAGEIVAYRWDLDGDGTFDEDGRTVATVFEEAGRHLVVLEVVTADGRTDRAKRTVTVSDGAIVHLGVGEVSVAAGETARLPVVLEGLPSGMATLRVAVSVADPAVAEGVGFEAARGLSVEVERRDHATVVVTVADPDDVISGRTGRVELGWVVIETAHAGASTVAVRSAALVDDEGRSLRVKPFDGKLAVGHADRELDRVEVVIDGAPNGLQRFGLTVSGPADAKIVRVESGLLGDDVVESVRGGRGHSSATVRGVDFADRVGAFDGRRTLVTVLVAGSAEPGAWSVEVGQLTDDAGGPIDAGRVRVMVRSPTPFDTVVPGSLGRGPPTDPDGDGLIEDVNGDGRTTISDAIAVAFVDRDRLTDDQAASLDFNRDGRFSFLDAVQLLRETARGPGR